MYIINVNDTRSNRPFLLLFDIFSTRRPIDIRTFDLQKIHSQMKWHKNWTRMWFNLIHRHKPTLLQDFKLGHVGFEILTKFNSNDDRVELFLLHVGCILKNSSRTIRPSYVHDIGHWDMLTFVTTRIRWTCLVEWILEVAKISILRNRSHYWKLTVTGKEKDWYHQATW